MQSGNRVSATSIRILVLASLSLLASASSTAPAQQISTLIDWGPEYGGQCSSDIHGFVRTGFGRE